MLSYIILKIILSLYATKHFLFASDYGTRIFPRQLFEFLFNSESATLFSSYLSSSLSSHPFLLFPSLFSQHARLGSKSFGPCTYVTRHSAAKTVSRDVASPLPAFLSLTMSFLSASPPSLFSREQKLLIYHSYEDGRGKLARASRREGTTRVWKEGGREVVRRNN